MKLNSFAGIFEDFKEYYNRQTSLIRGFDAFIVFGIMVTCLQIVYAGITGAHPFNSMVSGICGASGFFILVLSLRLHLTEDVKSGITPSRAFVDFVLCLLLLFLFVWNFMN